MKMTLVLVSVLLLTGCASTEQALPVPTGTFWGSTVENWPDDFTLIVTTDDGVCENAVDVHITESRVI
jgi:hypothetical protein